MANINIENISDLDLNGNNLFDDSEGFMTELSEDNELEIINGGYVPTSCITGLTKIGTCTETYAISI